MSSSTGAGSDAADASRRSGRRFGRPRFRRRSSGRGPSEPSAASPVPQRLRSPLLAAALSFLIPGAGQLYMGRLKTAIFFLVPAGLALGWGVWQLSQGFWYVTLSMLDDSYAITVALVAVGLTVWRILAITEPMLVSPTRRIGPKAGVVLAALLIATVGMGFAVASNAYDAYSADRQMAANDFFATASPSATIPPTADATATLGPTGYSESPSASASPTPSPTPPNPCGTNYPVTMSGPGSVAAALTGDMTVPLAFDADSSPTSATTDAASPTPGAAPSPSEMPTPSPTEPATPGTTKTPAVTMTSGATTTPRGTTTPVATTTPGATDTAGTPEPSTPAPPTGSPSPTPTPVPRLTVLLTGVDFISGRNHALNDTLMLVSINLQTRAVAMVSVPRDTAAFPYYWGGTAPVTFKINRFAGAVASHNLYAPDPPMVALANEIGYLVGIKVNYYAVIDMAGFSKMIDLVGGVSFYNPYFLNDPFFCTYVPAGNVHMNGDLALRYVRSRESSSDYQRSARQQLVMIALEKKMASPAMLPKLGSLLALAGKSIATNFPLNTAKNYVDIARNLSGISRCVLGPPYNYHPASTLTGGSWTSRLKLDQVAGLSVYLFGADSRYYGQPGVTPSACRNHS